MEENVEAAQDVLVRLAEFLRTTLREERVDRVPLLHELGTASHYLEIEAVRFKDRLRVVYSIANDCHHAMVPNLILQPLVENAVKHGSDTSNEHFCIEIMAERSGDRLRLSVQDDGRGCQDVDAALASGGIGLRNVGQRIALMYGPSGAFQVLSPGSRGFSVVLEMPFELEGEDHKSNEPHSNTRS
jgi:LytS/YehU family sensor histidine kinase